MIEETAFLPDTPVSVLSKGFGMAGFGSPTPIAVFTGASGTTISSVTADWLGIAHIITNASKAYLWVWDHYAFWDNAPNQNPGGLGVYNFNPRGSQYKDIESNTNYSYLRDIYYPNLDRLGQSDPIGLGRGINTYAMSVGIHLRTLNRLDYHGMPHTIPTHRCSHQYSLYHL
jgi:hypothetical protein